MYRLQIPLDSNFIAAALTILGYSINASIIVFDRVRENLRTARQRGRSRSVGESAAYGRPWAVPSTPR